MKEKLEREKQMGNTGAKAYGLTADTEGHFRFPAPKVAVFQTK